MCDLKYIFMMCCPNNISRSKVCSAIENFLDALNEEDGIPYEKLHNEYKEIQQILEKNGWSVDEIKGIGKQKLEEWNKSIKRKLKQKCEKEDEFFGTKNNLGIGDLIILDNIEHEYYRSSGKNKNAPVTLSNTREDIYTFYRENGILNHEKEYTEFISYMQSKRPVVICGDGFIGQDAFIHYWCFKQKDKVIWLKDFELNHDLCEYFQFRKSKTYKDIYFTPYKGSGLSDIEILKKRMQDDVLIPNSDLVVVEALEASNRVIDLFADLMSTGKVRVILLFRRVINDSDKDFVLLKKPTAEDLSNVFWKINENAKKTNFLEKMVLSLANECRGNYRLILLISEYYNRLQRDPECKHINFINYFYEEKQCLQELEINRFKYKSVISESELTFSGHLLSAFYWRDFSKEQKAAIALIGFCQYEISVQVINLFGLDDTIINSLAETGWIRKRENHIETTMLRRVIELFLEKEKDCKPILDEVLKKIEVYIEKSGYEFKNSDETKKILVDIFPTIRKNIDYLSKNLKKKMDLQEYNIIINKTLRNFLYSIIEYALKGEIALQDVALLNSLLDEYASYDTYNEIKRYSLKIELSNVMNDNMVDGEAVIKNIIEFQDRYLKDYCSKKSEEYTNEDDVIVKGFLIIINILLEDYVVTLGKFYEDDINGSLRFRYYCKALYQINILDNYTKILDKSKNYEYKEIYNIVYSLGRYLIDIVKFDGEKYVIEVGEKRNESQKNIEKKILKIMDKYMENTGNGIVLPFGILCMLIAQGSYANVLKGITNDKILMFYECFEKNYMDPDTIKTKKLMWMRKIINIYRQCLSEQTT